MGLEGGPGSQVALHSVEICNISTKQWRFGGKLGIGRFGPGLLSLGGEIYVLGGFETHKVLSIHTLGR